MARASLGGRLFASMMKWRNIKGMFADTARTAQIIEQCRQTNAVAYTMPAVKLKSQMERTVIADMDCVVLAHARPSGKVLWYLHGGAYIFHASDFHWQFLDRIVQHTRATVIATNYPLAPNHQAAEVVPGLRAVYQAIVAATPTHQVVVAGDSAGGGLALACAQDWRDQQLPQPAHLCLLSPWLDIAMQNPDAQSLDAGRAVEYSRFGVGRCILAGITRRAASVGQPTVWEFVRAGTASHVGRYARDFLSGCPYAP